MSDLAKREENGKKGERRTDAILLNRFWVLKRSADVDGADFLVQIQSDSLQELRQNANRIQALGIVQAKFFEGNNEVKIHRRYVLEEGEPRSDFFCLIHTDDADGEDVHYFLTAYDIVKSLRETTCGEYFSFRLASERSFCEYQNLKKSTILDTIEKGVANTEAKRNRDFIQRLFAIHFMATLHHDDNPSFEYHLKRLDGVNVVLCKNLRAHQKYLLDMRRDLFENQGAYNWGNDGTGSKFLTACIVAHHLNGAVPSPHQIKAVLRNLISKIAPNVGHVITTKDLEAALTQGVDSVRELVDKANFWLPPSSVAQREMFIVNSKEGHRVRAVDKYGVEIIITTADVKLLSGLDIFLSVSRKSIDVSKPDLLLGAYVLRDDNNTLIAIESLGPVLYDN